MWILVIILVVLALVGIPAGPHYGMGYYPAGGFGLIVIILIIILLVRGRG